MTTTQFICLVLFLALLMLLLPLLALWLQPVALSTRV